MTENQNNQPVQGNPTDKQKQGNPANAVNQEKKDPKKMPETEEEEEETTSLPKAQGDLKQPVKQEISGSNQNSNKAGF